MDIAELATPGANQSNIGMMLVLPACHAFTGNKNCKTRNNGKYACFYDKVLNKFRETKTRNFCTGQHSHMLIILQHNIYQTVGTM